MAVLDDVNPPSSRARRLVEGNSRGSRPGMAMRRRLQNSGWMTTGSVGGPEHVEQPGEPGGVVKVAVAADDGFELSRREVEASQVLPAPRWGHPGIEEQPVGPTSLGDLHVGREARLGRRRVDHLGAFEGEGLEGRRLAAAAKQTDELDPRRGARSR